MATPAAHFLHPKHELTLREYHLSRRCDLCGEKLTGIGYSCDHLFCDFDLHVECARYPVTLRSFFAHPSHDLTLASADDFQRVCNLCREEVPAGVFVYSCAPCGFAVHPRCSRLPQTARSELVHPDHAMSLTAMPSAGSLCAACRGTCGVWVYRCGQCDIDLHIECLHGCARGRNGNEDPSLLDQVMSVMDIAELASNVVELANNVAELANNVADALFSLDNL